MLTHHIRKSLGRSAAACIALNLAILIRAAPGDVDASFQNELILPPSKNAPVTILGTTLLAGGKILVGTVFGSGETNSRGYSVANTNAVVRLNSDGTLDNSFEPAITIGYVLASVGESFFGTILALSIQSDGQMLIGGLFHSISSIPRSSIARLKPDGALDMEFDPQTPIGEVREIVVQPDSKIIVAGNPKDFQTGIVRLNPDGTVDDMFAPQTEGGAVESVVLQPDNKIVFGGEFHSLDGIRRDGVARVNPDGSLDESFSNPRLGGWFPFVDTLALQPDGKIVIGGSFESVAGVSRRGIARLNANGTLDTSFNPGTGLLGHDSGGVRSVAVQSNGQVFISGNFERINGVARTNLARLNADGSVDITFVTRATVPRWAGLLLQPDGNVLLSGYSGSFIRLLGGVVLPSLEILRTGSEIALSWPVAGSTNAVLESTTSVTPEVVWTAEPASPQIIGDGFVFPIDSTAPARFFRLRKE